LRREATPQETIEALSKQVIAFWLKSSASQSVSQYPQIHKRRPRRRRGQEREKCKNK
jgi:hypothetical protein